MLYLALKYAHVIGAVVLIGTGAGIAFFMLMAHRTGDAAHIAMTAGTVVVADTLFTATAVILQPITGVLLAREAGYPLTDTWIVASLALYLLAGAAWLPVVAIQIRMRNLARAAVAGGGVLGDEYHRLFRRWFVLGFPGFGAVVAILWLMIARPS